MSNKIDLREPICRAFTTEPTTAAVSYTHLDVYKRQVLY